MAEPRCMVCRNKTFKPIIDHALSDGVSAAQIVRDVGAGGFAISAETINRHREHYMPPVEKIVVKDGMQQIMKPRGTDLAIKVRDMTLDAIEQGRLNIEDSNWKNVGPGLSAQKILDTREQKMDSRKTKIALAILLSGGPPPPELIESGEVIEGEAVEVVD